MKLVQIHEATRSQKWATPNYSGKSGFVYRGMSLDEWEVSLKANQIQSDSRHTYEHQEGGTCYGSFEDAEHYGIEVDIDKPEDINHDMRYGEPRQKPYQGVIIEIPRKLTASSTEDPRVDPKEFMHWAPIPISQVQRAWLLTPHTTNNKVSFTRTEIKLPWVITNNHIPL